ncbi:floral homeotic protein AGAMOUS-like [Humulus lupulus]|uniref:floral homeotic protein AGAMOUS-like n=1 Tax=Humulus lupulus TaxID=3486 RepID=UPI002B416D6F|nr:floral homeotic protein AGAMOUS-like [Humulus lupulus]
MGRGKLKLELIPDEKSRKTTFIKRKKGIMKKAYEFSVLCDVDICLLVSDMESGRVLTQTRRGSWSSSKNQEDHPHPQGGTTILETYPPESDNVLRIIQKYQKALTQRASNKSYDLAGLLAERNKKVQTEISRCRKKYYAFKYPASTDLLEGFSADDLAKLYGRLGVKIETVKKIIEDKQKGKAPLKAMKNENVFRHYQPQQQLFPPMVKNPPRDEFDSSAFSLSNNSNSMMLKLLGGDNNQSCNATTSSSSNHEDQLKKDYFINGISTTIHTNNNNNMHNGYGTTGFGPGRVYHHHQDLMMLNNNICTKNVRHWRHPPLLATTCNTVR